MFNGSTQFGRAYQEEMLRTAGFQDGGRLEAHRRDWPQKLALLSRLLGGLFRPRTETPDSQAGPTQKPVVTGCD